MKSCRSLFNSMSPFSRKKVYGGEANHAEAFWSALRRKCATFRRKTNMYAKATKGLQRLLRVYWVVHNFLRVHFTLREVPAVALGILERRLSVQEIFQIQMA